MCCTWNLSATLHFLWQLPLSVFGDKSIDFGAGGHGGLRAVAGDGDGGGGGGKARGGPGVFAFKQRHGKRAVEAVARAHRIDGLDGEGLHPRGLAPDGDVGAFRAEFEDYALEALVQKSLRGVFGRRFFAEIESGFGFVGSEPGDLVKDGVGQRGGGSGVENDGDAGLGAEGQGVSDGFNGQFQLAENHAGGTDQCSLEVDGG